MTALLLFTAASGSAVSTVLWAGVGYDFHRKNDRGADWITAFIATALQFGALAAAYIAGGM